jgi:hypothetical protein
MTMTDYQVYITQLHRQYLSSLQDVGETQAKLFEALRTVPTTSQDSLPSATEIVKESFGFASHVLDAQRDITLRLINPAPGTRPKAAGKQAA